MTTTQITNRIAELNKIILNSFSDLSVNGAAVWANAQIERETLKNLLCN